MESQDAVIFVSMKYIYTSVPKSLQSPSQGNKFPSKSQMIYHGFICLKSIPPYEVVRTWNITPKLIFKKLLAHE